MYTFITSNTVWRYIFTKNERIENTDEWMKEKLTRKKSEIFRSNV